MRKHPKALADKDREQVRLEEPIRLQKICMFEFETMSEHRGVFIFPE